ISEFFSGKENPGSRKIVRSNPEQRSGFYYILRVDKGWASLPEGSQLVVHYVPVEKIYPVTYKFDLDEGVRSWNGEIFFGLTGEEWTHGEGEPTAWKLQLVSAEGAVLAEKNSFLWSEPRKQ